MINQEIMESIGDDFNIAVPDQVMEYTMAELTIRDYLCSVCWGHLTSRRVSHDLEHVYCAQYPEEHSGFVTKHWVERQRQADAANYVDARDLLHSIGLIENQHKDKSAEQLLEELGY